MFDNLSTGNLEELSAEELSIAMGVTPASKKTTKKPNDESGSDKDDPTKKSSKKTQTSKGKADPVSKKVPISTLSSKDAALAFGKNEEEEEEEEEVLEEEEETKKGDDDESEEEEEEEEEETPEEEEEKEETDEEAQINNFIKARVDFLIKKGEWADWDDRDKTEWNEEKFAEVELQQREHQREVMREEILDKFGPYGKEIATFTENGGDPDELIDIFKEQQRAEAISLDSEEQKKDAVYRYETEFLGKKPASVKRYIDSLIADKALDEEASDAKEKMEEHWKTQAEELIASQKESAEDNKKKQLQSIADFSSKVKELVTAGKDVPDDEKEDLLKVLTTYNKNLSNGTPVNEFYFKFAEFRKNLPDYLDLVRFVLNKNKFIKSAETKGKNAATQKDFSLARTSNRSKKTRSGFGADAGSSRSSSKKSGFKLMY
jgi:hypothetical protein